LRYEHRLRVFEYMVQRDEVARELRLLKEELYNL
jgi:hypothetical protein